MIPATQEGELVGTASQDPEIITKYNFIPVNKPGKPIRNLWVFLPQKMLTQVCCHLLSNFASPISKKYSGFKLYVLTENLSPGVHATLQEENLLQVLVDLLIKGFGMKNKNNWHDFFG